MTGKIETVGVIGAGQMGKGIAQVAALAGFDVLLHDISKDRIQSALASIEGDMARQAEKDHLDEGKRGEAMQHISAAETLAALADADFVIETATEDETIKRKIFAELCPLLKPEAILATDTSSISITRLASNTDRPERSKFW